MVYWTFVILNIFFVVLGAFYGIGNWWPFNLFVTGFMIGVKLREIVWFIEDQIDYWRDKAN